MFELEANHDNLAADAIPDDIRRQFQSRDQEIRGYTVLPWEEHCTECAMPECYQTCDLYEPRNDGKCRRFIGGISPIKGTSRQIVGVAFKRWGQLMAYANLNMTPFKTASRVEKLVSAFDMFISIIPDKRISFKGRPSLTTRIERRLKQVLAKNGYLKDSSAGLPEHFLMEVFNPNPDNINLSLVVSNTDQTEYNMGYQELVELNPGFNRITIEFDKIATRLDLNKRFNITLNPNILDKADEGLTLYFGMLTFIWPIESNQSVQSATSPNIKVIAWDLDNTVWDGILIEDGTENLKLKPGILEIIKQLDKRGILNTVVSKNNPDDALSFLEHAGLKEYVVYPKIGWGQKGLYIRELIKDFNVGANTFAFIDDQPFERDEVKSLNPDVRVYDALEYDKLLAMPEFNPRVSSESHLRRQLYQYEKTRQDQLSTFDGDYLTFLQSCEITLNIDKAGIEKIERIQELVQRTNQLNFSGNRYQREQIEAILEDDQKDAFVIDCHDKYGIYGTIGFAIVNSRNGQLIDLMFSCRVQSKRVEHAFISFLLSYYKTKEHSHLSALYKESDRNKKAATVFTDMNFFIKDKQDNLTTFAYDLSKPIPDDGVIKVIWSGT
ncbi:MAG: HAD-IIIC family phosphatase [Candidatus Thiodiazotropha sp. LLP2]